MPLTATASVFRFLADRPQAVPALTAIFLDEIERLLCDAAGVFRAENAPTSAQPRLGAVSFLHRFGSALNRHVHLHACVTDDVFTATDSADGVAFLPARPISPADLVKLTEQVRRRLLRWFRRRRLIAFITDPAPIRKILTHLGTPLEPSPLAPARGPPIDWPDLVQAHDDRDVVQASSDELPVIDIHTL